MTDRLDLPSRYRDQVETLLREHVPGVEVWAYGSRVNGESHDASDLDLVLRGPDLERIPSGQLADLNEALEQSNVPILVQIHDWERLPESFLKEIEQAYVVLIKKEELDMRSGWPEIPFAQLLVEPVRNGIYKKKEFHGRGVKIVNMREIFAYPRLRNLHMKRVELSEKEKHRISVIKGDLLFARRSFVAEGAGKCSVVLEADEPTTFESSIIRARPDPAKAYSLFLYYYFSSPFGLHALDSIRRQVAVAGITGSDLARLNILVPPLPEQRAIAHILGTLDDKIELNRRMNETLEEIVRALFKSWFVDFDPVRAKMEGRDPGLPKHLADLFPDDLVDSELGPIPEGWEVKALGDCFNLTMGQSPPGSTYNEHAEGMPFFQGRTDFGFRYPEKRRYCTAPTRVAEPDDTLISVRAPVGDINMAWEQCCIGRGVAALRHKSGSSSYTYHFAWAIQGELQQYEHMGTVFGAINKTQFESLKTIEPMPEVVREFGSIVLSWDKYIRSNTAESRTLAALRDALLPKLISGNMRVNLPKNFSR